MQTSLSRQLDSVATMQRSVDLQRQSAQRQLGTTPEGSFFNFPPPARMAKAPDPEPEPEGDDDADIDEPDVESIQPSAMELWKERVNALTRPKPAGTLPFDAIAASLAAGQNRLDSLDTSIDIGRSDLAQQATLLRNLARGLPDKSGSAGVQDAPPDNNHAPALNDFGGLDSVFRLFQSLNFGGAVLLPGSPAIR